ncbi:hypothetical protein ABZ570_18700, partial [Micromonospora sp. NPDC007271]|uniref:hypothetical protein n=1 Tax=Micromonospora sp. NPDC007271 TaxID=3154587 RepID=UPI0033F445A1
MAFRTWSRLLLTALGVGVLAGAGQLGLAYGFGVVRLDGAFTDGAVNRWPAQLAWVGWFAAVAAVAGAVATERLARRDGAPGGTTEQLALAGAAALGATVVAPLCMRPARTAELAGTVDPVWAVGICAILGAVVGAGAAIIVLLKPPFGWNIAIITLAVWLFALASAAPSVSATGPLVTVRLGVLEPSWLDATAAQRLATLLLPLIALLAGAAVGALARRRGHLPLVGGAAGAAGPVLLAFAYLTAGPGTAADRYQLAPYYGALIAVAAGALGSAATTVLRRTVVAPETAALEPTDILQPLPPVPTIPGHPAPADGPEAAVPSTAEDTTGGADEPVSGREVRPTGAVAATPAHWDWPAPAGLTPAPVPAHGSRAERTSLERITADDRVTSTERITADDRVTSTERIPSGDHTAAADPATIAQPTSTDPTTPAQPTSTESSTPAQPTSTEPATPAQPTSTEPASPAELVSGPPTVAEEPDPGVLVATPAAPTPDASPSTAGDAGTDEPSAGRDADDLARSLPVPGLLPSGRRTSAIDVLAAGRPAEHPPVAPHGQTPASAGFTDLAPSPGSDVAVPAQMDSPVPVQARRDPADSFAAGSTPADPPAAETPMVAPADSAPGGTRPDGRSRRGRKVRTGPTTTTTSTKRTLAEPAPAEPASAHPDPAEAVSIEPISVEPAQAKAAPAKPAPLRATPAQAAPVEVTPAQTAPAQTAPAPAAPTPATPTQAAPTQATPTQAAPTQAAPTQAAPADPSLAASGAPGVDAPGRSAPPVPRPAGGPDSMTGRPTSSLGGEPSGAAPGPAPAEGGRSRPRYFFSDDEPTARDLPASVDAPASPRPRFPIFEDVTDQPDNALSAWPAALPPSPPVAARPSEPAAPPPSRPVAPPPSEPVAPPP